MKTIAGKLIAVSDGDTFTLLTADNVQYKIRLNGIDCPEKGLNKYPITRRKEWGKGNAGIVIEN
ncbi:MAG: hypothetical protein FGM41_03860 [Bacteroidetes bacterium]|nr:hypothetical protein [Bacteroidota bacterium]